MRYSCRWRRLGFFQLWKKENNIIGHNYEREMDKMIFYFECGSIREVCQWSKCELKLGQDWVLFTKNMMEKESGNKINLSVGK